MKKIIRFLLLLIFLISYGVSAGGIELLPILPDFFSGFSIGIVGSFWDASFNQVSASGRVICDVLTREFEPTPEVIWTGTCVTPEVDVFPASPINQPITQPDLSIISDNHAEGIEKTGAIGFQFNLGRTFLPHFIPYYLGVYGGIQWGNVHDMITSEVHFFQKDFAEAVDINKPDDLSVDLDLNDALKQQNVYNIGVQLGVLLTDRTLSYFKIGSAWTKVATTVGIGAVTPFFDLNDVIEITHPPFTVNTFNDFVNLSGLAQTHTNDDIKQGIEVGFGFSQAITDNVQLSMEYLFRDFGEISTNEGPIFIPPDLIFLVNTGNFPPLPDSEITINPIKNPLFYQATNASVHAYHSAVNLILSYRFYELF